MGIASLTVFAGVGGGIFADVGLDLHDPDGDGKVYFDELADDVARGGPLGIFDATGSVGVGLTAEILIRLKFLFFSLTVIDAHWDVFTQRPRPSRTRLALAAFVR